MKYIDLNELTFHLNDLGSSKSQKELCLRMLRELKRNFHIKRTNSGFTLYAPYADSVPEINKIKGRSEQLFANFHVSKNDYFEVRFLYHGHFTHPNVKEFPEMKNGELNYLLNQYITTSPFEYDDLIKKLMHDSYDVIHEGKHKEIKEKYKLKNNLN